jgi:hypothetical protein
MNACMNSHWIDMDSTAQREWAKKYLLKKTSDLGRSVEGVNSARNWDEESTDPLDFLTSIEKNKGNESDQVLIRSMKLAWAQNQRNQKFKKSKAVRISNAQSKKLKSLAAKSELTQEKALDKLICEEHKLRADLEKVQREIKTLVKDKEDLEKENKKLNDEVSKLRGEIDKLTAKDIQ